VFGDLYGPTSTWRRGLSAPRNRRPPCLGTGFDLPQAASDSSPCAPDVERPLGAHDRLRMERPARDHTGRPDRTAVLRWPSWGAAPFSTRCPVEGHGDSTAVSRRDDSPRSDNGGGDLAQLRRFARVVINPATGAWFRQRLASRAAGRSGVEREPRRPRCRLTSRCRTWARNSTPHRSKARISPHCRVARR